MKFAIYIFFKQTSSFDTSYRNKQFKVQLTIMCDLVNDQLRLADISSNEQL